MRWRFVATEMNTELREDNHQGTPPLTIVRATVSRAGSCPTSAGVHMRMIRSWNVGPETALVDDRVGECETRRFR